ncbi:Rrf2 family transcriptional regulator [Paenibacillus campi]|uniref:RrF2 family transcriptional regulator n=1 Tax=Paenibacillus campi TaxID=3106031 RepID=UPI002AFDE362|nr:MULTISPECIES: Rrf2 family transcriptional regulator [unclassified Paenibacillus]
MTVSRARTIGPARFNTAVHALAGLAHNGGTVSSSIIAAQVQSHATFLRRILATLASHGIVDTREGRDGGYSLRIPADTLTLADIYQAIRTEEQSGRETYKAGCAPLGEALSGVMQDAERQVVEYLKKYTLADLLHDANQRKKQENARETQMAD